MNKPTKQDLLRSTAEVFLALADGKEIEIEVWSAGGWKHDGLSRYLVQDHEIDLRCYRRIKPAPKLRAWRIEEVPLDAWYRIKGTSSLRRLIVIDEGIVVFCCFGDRNRTTFKPYTRSMDGMLQDMKHSLDGGKTWKACGVEE